MASYKYKVDNYDEIINNPSIKTGTLYGIYYDFIAEVHEYFSCEYKVVFVRNVGEMYGIIASDACVPLRTRKAENAPMIHEHMQYCDLRKSTFDDGKAFISQGYKCITAVYPEDRDKLLDSYNQYLDGIIALCQDAKL
jgi:hypothetical protein